MSTPCLELCEQLAQSDESVVYRAMLAAGARPCKVTLVEGELSLEEVLAYARVMLDLGCLAEAEELVASAIEAGFSHQRRHCWTGDLQQTM